MNLRRGLMAQMGGSIFDKMLQVVAFASVSENTREITFSDVELQNGGYILISNPAGNPTNAATATASQIPDMLFFQAFNGSTRGRYLSSVKQDGAYDYWGDPVITINGTDVTIRLSSSSAAPKYEPGYIYYLCRVKR